MKNTILVSVLLIFVIAIAFAGTEEQVMQKYDYSSPKASWDSLQQAIQNKDLEGVVIHQWQLMKNNPDTIIYNKSFEEAVDTIRKLWVEPDVEERTRKIWEEYHKNPNSGFYNKTFEEALTFAKEREEQRQSEGAFYKEIPIMVEHFPPYSNIGFGAHNSMVTDVRFVKEIDREKSEDGCEICRIEVEDSSSTKRGYTYAFCLDSNHWWIMIGPDD